MPTPIQRRFFTETNFNDNFAGTQSLHDVAVIVPLPAVPATRFVSVTASDYSSMTFDASITVDLKEWLKTFFAQVRTAAKVYIIYISVDDEPVENVMEEASIAGCNPMFLASLLRESDTDGTTLNNDIADYAQTSDARLMFVSLTFSVEAKEGGVGYWVGLRAGSFDQTMVIVHPLSTTIGATVIDTSAERPDAAILGAMSPTDAGVYQWDYNDLARVTDGGYSSGEQEILTGLGVQFIESFENTTFTHLFSGRSVTGREFRLQWGAYFFDIMTESDLATYAMQTPLMAFDLDTFAAVESIFNKWKTVLIDRRIILDTKEYPAIVKFPNPLSIPVSVRATGTATLNDAYCFYMNTAVDEWIVRGNIKLAI